MRLLWVFPPNIMDMFVLIVVVGLVQLSNANTAPCDDGVSAVANAHCSVIKDTNDSFQDEKHFIGGLRSETDTESKINILVGKQDLAGISEQHGTHVTGDVHIDAVPATKVATGQITGSTGENAGAPPSGGRYSRFRYKRQQANGDLLNHQVHAERMTIQYSSVGLVPGFADPVTVQANVKFSDGSSTFQGNGLWKLSMYGSKNSDGTGEQFARYEQLLTTAHQSQAVTPGAEVNFNQASGDIDVTRIGCDVDYRYICFDFMKGDNPNPLFTFTTFQDDTSKITFCDDRCQTRDGTAILIRLKYNMEATGVTEGQKDSFTINATASFSQASADIQGTGLWKLSMYGSRNTDGSGEQLERIDQVLTTAQQDLPLIGATNISFVQAGGEFDFNQIGCGTEFRYLCFEFTKGDNPNPDFQFILHDGFSLPGSSATTLRTCNDKCAHITNGVLTAGLRVQWKAHDVQPGVKDHVTMNVTVQFSELSDEIRGFGLWKLSMYGSKNPDGSGEQFQRFEQVLTNSHQAQPLIGDQDIIFYGANGEIDVTSIGCDKDFRYVCFDLMKGDFPFPDFDYTSFQTPTNKTTLCSNSCKQIPGTAVVRGMNITYTAAGVLPNQRDPFTINATILVSQASASIAGTNLWKLSMYGSSNKNGTGDQYQRVEQLLNTTQQAQPITEGRELVFTNARGNLDILGIGCGRDYQYLCFDFTKGDNPQPNFNFTSLIANTNSLKITLCTDRCSQAQDLNLQNGFILVADLAAAVRIAPLDTFNDILTFQTIPLQQLGAPVAVDFDPVHQKIYFTDVLTKTIQRSDLDGSLQEVMFSLGSEATPDGLAVDEVNRLLYWTDATLQRIEKSNLDRGQRSVVLTSPKPRAIVVEETETNSRLFWTDWGTTPKIERANADGTNRVTLINTNLQWPNGLAVDFAGGRMYWCEAGLNRIESSDLNGNNRVVHLNTGNNLDIHPYDIGIYQDVIVWSDWAFRNLVRMDGWAPQARLTGNPVFRRGGGLHIQHAFQLRTRRSISQNNGPFAECHDVVSPSGFFQQCKENWCDSQSYQQLCDDVGAYAMACQLHGIDVGDWRDAIGCDGANGNQ